MSLENSLKIQIAELKAENERLKQPITVQGSAIDILRLSEENAELKASAVRMESALTQISTKWGGCMCGHAEWCENCSSGSSINQARKLARQALSSSPTQSLEVVRNFVEYSDRNLIMLKFFHLHSSDDGPTLDEAGFHIDFCSTCDDIKKEEEARQRIKEEFNL